MGRGWSKGDMRTLGAEVSSVLFEEVVQLSKITKQDT